MKDLKSFTSKDKKETRPLRKDEGADDQEYIDLMGYYKHVARRTMDRNEANKYLDKAIQLATKGDVSKNAKIAAAYI